MIKNFLLSILVAAPLVGLPQSKLLTIKGSHNGPSAKLVSENDQATTLRFNLNEVTLHEIETGDGKSYIVSSSSAPRMLKAGVPDLFYLSQSVIIPASGSTEIEVIPGSYTEYFDVDVAPSKGNLMRNVNPSDVPYKKGSVYSVNQFFPGNYASIREPYILRDFRAQTVDVYPVQYNPITKTLRVYEEIIVVLKHSARKGINEMSSSKSKDFFDSEFSKIYSRLFINFNQSKYTPLDEEGDLLIICFDDFMEAMQPFVDWKRTIGRKTEMVSKTEAGSTSDAIKSFIANYYNNPEHNLAYVLLVGDAQQIPTNSTTSGHSDNTYGYIEGNDSYSEVFIGRFSAETIAHVETQVKRMIEYERDLNSTDTWLNKGLGVARNEGEGSGHNGEADYQHIDFIRDTLLNYTYTEVYREYDGNVPGLTNTHANAISTKINTGVSIINYCNHGSETGWSVADYNSNHVNALTNTRKLPFIWAVACVNGAFVNTTSFSETWLRATHNGEPSGAIGTFMSTINQAWQPPMTGQDEMVTILSESLENNIKRTFGGLSLNGSMKMLDVHGASGKETHDTWTIFGDPTLMVRTNTPEDMVVSHTPTLFIGSTVYSVTCDTDGALVAISYKDQEETVQLLATAFVQDGVAAIEFPEPINQPLDLTVAVTAYNKTTYIGTVSSVPADRPYIILNSFTTSAAPNYGEDINFNISLKNVSETPFTANSIHVTLSSVSEYVDIQSSTLNAGNIAPGQTIDFDDAFSLSIASNVPDQTRLIFKIDFVYAYNDGEYQSSQTFLVKANAPVLTIGGITVDDGGEGIPGVLDPGETSDVKIRISNIGHADAADINVTVSTASEYITVNGNDTFAFENLAAGASDDAIFSLTANPDTPLETSVSLEVDATSGEYQHNKSVLLIVGYIPEYKMGQVDEVTACIGKFYDSGGTQGQYSNDENTVMTFKPSGTGNALMFHFVEFDVEEGWDYLYVYDGENTDAPEIEGSPFSGTNLPSDFMATSQSGAITFKFVSDGYVSADGWVAEFSCVDLSVAPTCASSPFPADGEMAILSPLKLNWSFVPGALLYDVYFGKDQLPAEPTASVPYNFYSVDIEEESSYVWKVVPRNDAGQADGCETWGFYTEELADIIKMHNGSITTCNTILYDTGGIDGDYQNNENLRLTIKPSDPWAKIVLSFSEFKVEDGWDYLKVYNGTSTSVVNNLIGTYTGSTLPPVIVSTHASGALSLHFTSDSYVNDKGWMATIGCQMKWQPVTFEVKNGSSNPLEGVKITTPLSELFTNTQGKVTNDFPQNCQITYEISKEGFSLQEGNFFLGEEPKTLTFVMYPVSSELTDLDNVNIYPNPFTNTITISDAERFENYSITTITGQTIANAKTDGKQTVTINSSNLPKGVYLLVLSQKNGEAVVRKIVKE